MATRVEIDSTALKLLYRALKAEADGKELARDLRRGLRAVAQPAKLAAQAAILTMPSKHQSARNRHDPRSIREAIANSITVNVSLTGKRSVVAIKQHRRGMPRRGRNVKTSTLWRAGRMFNAGSIKGGRIGWFHPTFGHGPQVFQVTSRRWWFDGTLARFRGPAVEAAAQALDATARRVSERTKG